jgi:hypothetical protein
MQTESLIGRTLTCAETGKQFIGASDGFTTNYARNDAGEVFSDEGVHLREVRALLNRSSPFTGYLSSDGKRLTGWKGNTLGHVVDSNPCELTRLSHTHGKYYQSVRVRDVHGREWYGRGSPGICIRLRPTKP